MFGNGFGAQGVGDIEPAVAHVQALVETLGAATDDNGFFAPELVDAAMKLRMIHESAFSKLLQLKTQGKGVKVIHEVIQLRSDNLTRQMRRDDIAFSDKGKFSARPRSRKA